MIKFFGPSLILLLLTHQSLSSQNSDIEDPDNSNSYLTFNPLSLGDPHAPRLRFGYVQHIKDHWKASLEAGFGSREIMIADQNPGEKYRLWEIRPEIYYVLKPNAKTIKYISAEFFYINQKNTFANRDYQSENGQDFRFDRADFTRKKYGMHFKFGLFLNLGKKFGFNFYGGVGFRFKNNQYSNVLNPVDEDIFREWYVAPHEVEGKDFLPNPSLGLKFYYKI